MVTSHEFISDMSLKITHLILHLHLPGANGLKGNLLHYREIQEIKIYIFNKHPEVFPHQCTTDIFI